LAAYLLYQLGYTAYAILTFESEGWKE